MNLTNPFVMIDGKPQYFPTQEAAAVAGSKALPSSAAMFGPDPLNPTPEAQGVPSQVQKLPFLKQDQQAPALENKGLTKGGKLLSFLLSMGKGALNGMEANAQTYAQTGRNGGFGGGFAGATTVPMQHQAMQQQVNRGALENQMLNNQVAMAPLLQRIGLQKSQADLNKTNAEVSGMPAKQRLEEAQAIAARYKEDPSSGALIDLQTMQPVNGGGLVPVRSQEIADVLNVPVGTQVPLAKLSKAADVVTKGITTVNTEEGVFERNRITGKNTRLGNNPRNIFAPENKIIEVPDPEHPGQTRFLKAGTALNNGSAGIRSASLLVPKKVMEWATTGKGGEEINAFNTALQHADLLEQALTALGNGDQRTLSSLKNRFKTEFGSSDVTNFQTIANAYSREITKMLSSGHMTDNEISEQGATLPSNASPEQILDTLNAYRQLAASKMQMRYNQYQQGMAGKPNFPSNNHPAPGSRPVVVNGVVVGHTTDGKTMIPVVGN